MDWRITWENEDASFLENRNGWDSTLHCWSIKQKAKKYVTLYLKTFVIKEPVSRLTTNTTVISMMQAFCIFFPNTVCHLCKLTCWFFVLSSSLPFESSSSYLTSSTGKQVALHRWLFNTLKGCSHKPNQTNLRSKNHQFALFNDVHHNTD